MRARGRPKGSGLLRPGDNLYHHASGLKGRALTRALFARIETQTNDALGDRDGALVGKLELAAVARVAGHGCIATDRNRDQRAQRR